MKVKTKLLLNFLTSLGLALFVTWIIVSGMNNISGYLFDFSAWENADMIMNEELTESALRLEVIFQQFLANPTDKTTVDGLLGGLKKVNSGLEEWKKTFVTAKQKEMLMPVAGNFDTELNKLRDSFEKFKIGKETLDQIKVDFGSRMGQFSVLAEKIMDETINVEKSKAHSSLLSAMESTKSTILLMMLLMIFFQMGLSYNLRNSILFPIKLAIDQSYKVSKGDISSKLSIGNPVKCSVDCQETDCPAYGKETHCWLVAGSFAIVPKCRKLKEISDCRNCQVFQQNVGSEVQELGTALNALTEVLSSRADLAEKVASGDLTIQVPIASEKDVLGKSLRKMTERLNDLVSRVNASSINLNSSASQLASASQSLAEGVSEQAATIEEVSASMVMLSAKTNTTREGAFRASQLAISAKNEAEHGNKEVKQMMESMMEIAHSSKEIAKVIKIIDEIAFQTNILSLNAAVEAARAGSHGKGFAVVANEVRSLATRSANAAQGTTSLIESSVNQVAFGQEISRRVVDSFSKISKEVFSVSGLIDEIARAAVDLTSGIDQVKTGMVQMEQASQASASTAEETASAAQSIASDANSLQEMMGTFKLEK